MHMARATEGRVEPEQPFSEELESWLRSPGKKTLGELLDVFDEKSFAMALLVLMITPALPLPTGGVTHVFELITMLIALQMVIGRQSIWLPKRLRRRELGPATTEKAIPFIARRVRWFERFARPRFARGLRQRAVLSPLGLIVLAFTIGAFVAIPFTGLDTLPSLGVVVIALSLILEDALITLIGIVIGAAGIALEIALGSAALHFFGL
jgi:hypothetical protein